jgi:hypothetical protein
MPRVPRVLTLLPLGLLACGPAGSSAEPSAGSAPVPGPVSLSGSAQKGPLIAGSTVVVATLDSDGNPTGEAYRTETTDDLGRFSLELDHVGPVLVEVDGYAYNEATGQLGVAPTTLRAWAVLDGSATASISVNALTHLSAPRVAALVASGETAADAIETAEDELVAALGIGGPGYDPGAAGIELSLHQGSSAGADLLFALSTALAQTALLRAGDDPGTAEARLQELLNRSALDLADDGALESALTDELDLALASVETWRVQAELEAHLAAIDSTVAAPELDAVVDTDGDGVMNADDTCLLIENVDQLTIPDGACTARWAAVEAEELSELGALRHPLAADLDGDGADELALVDAEGSVHLFTGDGAGGLTWTERLDGVLGLGPGAAGDVDGDGDLDLVFVGPYPRDEYSYTVEVFVNDGAGGLSGPTSVIYGYDRGVPVVPPVLEDMDLDGTMDLAIGSCVLPFTSASSLGAPVCSYEAEDPAGVADLNEDGWPDLVMVGRGWFVDAHVRLSDGAGGYTTVVVGDGTDRAAEVTDLDGDGHLDLLLQEPGQDPTVAMGDGAGGFAVSTLALEGCFSGDVRAADLSGSGTPELLCSDLSGDELLVFDPTGRLTNRFAPGRALDGVLADTEGDGGVDLVVPVEDVGAVLVDFGS